MVVGSICTRGNDFFSFGRSSDNRKRGVGFRPCMILYYICLVCEQ